MTGEHVTPTTTATPARVRLFQPTQRPRVTTGEWIQTSWGRCRVVGRLGQRHADLLEAMLFVAERSRETDDGAIELLVDPARVRRTLSDRRHSLGRIREWLRELRSATIEIESPHLPAEERLLGGLIDHVEPSPMTRHNPLSGGERHLWRVRLGKPLVELLKRDLLLWYDPAPLARLQYGISQAVARHVLTHRRPPDKGWKLDGLIKVVCGVLGSQARRDARRRIRKDGDGLSAAGVVLDGDRVSVAQRPDSVAYRPGGMAHRPGAWHSGPMRAGISDISGAVRPRT